MNLPLPNSDKDQLSLLSSFSKLDMLTLHGLASGHTAVKLPTEPASLPNTQREGPGQSDLELVLVTAMSTQPAPRMKGQTLQLNFSVISHVGRRS